MRRELPRHLAQDAHVEVYQARAGTQTVEAGDQLGVKLAESNQRTGKNKVEERVAAAGRPDRSAVTLDMKFI